ARTRWKPFVASSSANSASAISRCSKYWSRMLRSRVFASGARIGSEARTRSPKRGFRSNRPRAAVWLQHWLCLTTYAHSSVFRLILTELCPGSPFADRDAMKHQQKKLTMPYQKGESGNPAGRPRGSRNKRTLLAEAMFEARGPDLIEKLIEVANMG